MHQKKLINRDFKKLRYKGKPEGRTLSVLYDPQKLNYW